MPLICLTSASSDEWVLTKLAVMAMDNLASRLRRSKPKNYAETYYVILALRHLLAEHLNICNTVLDIVEYETTFWALDRREFNY